MDKIKILLHKITGPDIPTTTLLISLALIIFMESLTFLHFKYNLTGVLMKRNIIIRWTIYSTAIIILLLLGIFENKKFIYFQF